MLAGVLQDVLVATDVASKGLDFPEIQHVINYDMPDEIENYVSCCCLPATMYSYLGALCERQPFDCALLAG